MPFLTVKGDSPDLDIEDEDNDEAPGLLELENALEAMKRGHVEKALDMMVDAVYAYSTHHDRLIPWHN